LLAELTVSSVYFWTVRQREGDEVTGDRGKLPPDFCSPLNITKVDNSRRMRWAGHVARMRGEERLIQGFGEENLGKKSNWKSRP
jgi:hypothetical protein